VARETQRVQVEIADLLREIDAYPEAAGVDPEMWAEMNYPQKLKYLLKQQLKVTKEKLDEIKD